MFGWLQSVGNGMVLPKPSGPYPVGFIDYEWKPPKTEYTTHPSAFALVRIYYPSSQVSEEYGKWIPSSDYLPDSEDLVYSGLQVVCWSSKVVGCRKCSCSHRTIPLAVYSHGLGGIRTTYSSICTDLASHGFIVAAIEHRWLWRFIGRLKAHLKRILPSFLYSPGTNACLRDGSASMTIEQEQVKPYNHPEANLPDDEIHQFRSKQLLFRAQEVSATIDLMNMLNCGTDAPLNLWRLMHVNAPPYDSVLEGLKHRIDTLRTIALGHSFGAATSFFASSIDDRIKAVIAMDPWMYPLPRPFAHRSPYPLLIINSETFHWETNLTALKSLLHHNVSLSKGKMPSMMVTLKQTGHMDQSDFTVALPSYVTSRFRPNQTADPVSVLRSNNDIILGFLKDSCGYTNVKSSLSPLRTEEERKKFETEFNCIIDYI